MAETLSPTSGSATAPAKATRIHNYRRFDFLNRKWVDESVELGPPRPHWVRTPGRVYAELDDNGSGIVVSDGINKCHLAFQNHFSRREHVDAKIKFPGVRLSPAQLDDVLQQFACALNEATEDAFGVSHEVFLQQLSEMREGEFVDWQLGIGTAPTSALPVLESATDLIGEDIQLPEEIVRGLIHRDTKVILGGGSKVGKTMLLLDLSISVATGRNFWNLETNQGRVVYLNFEIDRRFMRSRVHKLCEAREIPVEDLSEFHLWNLRGVNKSLAELTPELTRQVEHDKPALVIIDPIYKCLGSLVENAAEDIAKLCIEIEAISVATGSAVAYAAHYSKGNQSGKDAIDRISGSGVFARDADSIINLTRHREANCYTVETTLRNLPSLDPFVVEWQYPLMKAREDLNPMDLKPARDPKKAPEVDLDALLKHVPETGAADKDIIITRLNKAGVGIVKAKAIINGWIAEGLVHKWSTERPGKRDLISYGRTPQPPEAEVES